MKNTYYCIDREIDGLYISQVLKIRKGGDLLTPIKLYNINSVTPCETKKEAETMADTFNKGYFDNQCYFYQKSGKIYPSNSFCLSY